MKPAAVTGDLRLREVVTKYAEDAAVKEQTQFQKQTKAQSNIKGIQKRGKQE